MKIIMKRVLFLITGIFFIGAASYGEGPYKPGDNATDFNLKNLKGETVSLSGNKEAKGFIVVFTCNTCPVAKQYEKRIIDLHEEFADKGYPVVAINSNDKTVSPGDSFEEMKKLAKSKGYEFEYLYDESQEVAKQYGATNTPHVYILSRKGANLRTEYVGAIDNNADDASKADKHYVKDAVNALLKGEQVPVGSTKAIGCSVKWKKA
jgi:peroxiredoxin